MVVFKSFTPSPQLLLEGYSVRCLLRICFVGADCPLAHTRQNISELLQSLFTDVSWRQEQLNQPHVSCICTAFSRVNHSWADFCIMDWKLCNTVLKYMGEIGGKEDEEGLGITYVCAKGLQGCVLCLYMKEVLWGWPFCLLSRSLAFCESVMSDLCQHKADPRCLSLTRVHGAGGWEKGLEKGYN